MNQEKDYQDLTFADDFIFCKVLLNNPDLCKELVELILGRKIKRIVQLEDQKRIDLTPDGKGIRMDVYFEGDDNVVYNIEMQTSDTRNLPKRSRYYQGMIDLNVLEKGVDYEKLKDTYIVFICTFNLLPKYGRHVYTFEQTCVEDQQIRLEDGTRKVFLCTEGTEDDISEELKNFLEYVAGRSQKGKFTEKLEDAVTKVKAAPQWRKEYMKLMLEYEEKRKEGFLEALVGLVRDKLLDLSTAAQRAGLSEADFQKAVDAYPQHAS